jgi:bacteriocin-like protein
MQIRKDSPKQDNRPSAPLPVQPLTEKEMSSISGGGDLTYYGGAF